ncbi:ribonucleases P/MRP protein subunit POP1 [Armigeres subalbatus]|uniref:ribonucleases P/MRP protein subunit POP1 n=1 Tax=Armigeres subalbatus TaxID=124917 RepID=UPI002ED5CCA9
MSSQSIHYDAALGGPIKLPDEIDSIHFNEDRVTELKCFLRAITNTENQTKLVHQSLPLHMRRRAMSYNPKRLPRKFRSAHVAQYSKSGLPEKKKRPSRKYRRKARNLLQEYNRRKRTYMWMETHIWHAKRFHMIPKWGYKIPYTPTNKGHRACYRATAKHCLIQDISYYGCIEIQGPEDVMKNHLRRICSEKIGLTIAAKAFLNGQRSGNVFVYKKDQYPNQCLGEIKFVWKSESSKNEKRILWMFVHPAFYKELMEELVVLFELRNAYRDDYLNSDEPLNVSKIIKNVGTVRIPKYENPLLSIEIKALKDTLNYFRLTGPLSHAVLTKSLKPYQQDISKNVDHWFSDWIQTTGSEKSHIQQFAFWEQSKNLTTPAVLSPGLVVSSVIEDPRLNRKKKRTKALPDAIITNRDLPETGLQLSCSPIWNESIRDIITTKMLSTHQLNVLRGKQSLVPGEPCAFENDIQPVPILLIQNPGSQDADYKQLGYGAGWDLIAPSGYGLPIWQTLIMWGAKPAGLKETDMQALESGIDTHRVPDTVLGRAESDVEYEEKWYKYYARPNNRRINYKKLAIASPFRCPWLQLVSEWTGKKETDFYVLRDQESLSKAHHALNRKFNLKSALLPPSSLIPLYLTMKTRGNPGDNALICLPLRSDFRQNKQNRLGSDLRPVYTEPLRKDPQQKERLLLRSQHLRLLKRLRNRRIRQKKALQLKNPGTLIRIAKPQNDKLIKEHLTKVRELWLPANPESIRNQCSRECFGYVTQCNFGLSEAKVTALGYVTAKGLEKLYKTCTKGTFKVLVRGTKSRCYRFATIKIRTD